MLWSRITGSRGLRQREWNYLACNRCSINRRFVLFPSLYNQAFGARQLHFPKPFSVWASWAMFIAHMFQPDKPSSTGRRYQQWEIIFSFILWLFSTSDFILFFLLPKMVFGGWPAIYLRGTFCSLIYPKTLITTWYWNFNPSQEVLYAVTNSSLRAKFWHKW